MRWIRKSAVWLLLLALCLGLAACSEPLGSAGKDEVFIRVHVETEDEIEEFLHEYGFGEKSFATGGTRAADWTPMKAGEVIFETLERNAEPPTVPEDGDLTGFWMEFSVGLFDEAVTPVPVEGRIDVPVEFGHNYDYRLTGSWEKGYKLERMEEP